MDICLGYIGALLGLEPADLQRLQTRFAGDGVIQIEFPSHMADGDPADVFEFLFGDRRVSPQRLRFLSAAVTNGELLESGWTPRSRANNGIDTLANTTDYHVWCVDKTGRVFDYPDDQVASNCTRKTNTIVRKAWSNELDEGIRPRLEQLAQTNIQQLIREKGSKDALMRAIEDNTFPRAHCLARAYLLYESNPSEYKVVIGSFGFVQSDGKTWWELG